MSSWDRFTDAFFNAKVMAKYPNREIRYLEVDRDEEEIIE